MTATTVPQVLNAAADVIERNGLHKGQYYDWDQHLAGTPLAECRVCVLGGIRVAVTGSPASNAVTTAAVNPIYDAVGVFQAWLAFKGQSTDITRWNDTPKRSKTQVVTGLRAASAWIGETDG